MRRVGELSFLHRLLFLGARIRIGGLLLVWLAGVVGQFVLLLESSDISSETAALVGATLGFLIGFVYALWPFAVHLRLSHLYREEIRHGPATTAVVLVGYLVFAILLAWAFAATTIESAQARDSAFPPSMGKWAVIAFLCALAVGWWNFSRTIVRLERSAGPGYFWTFVQLFYMPVTIGFLRSRIRRLEDWAPRIG